MEDKLITAVRNWLNHIMPDVTNSLVSILTPDSLTEMTNEEGIHGPYSIDIAELRDPITSINFYVVAAMESVLIAVTADIKDAREDYNPDLSFDMFFEIEEFAAKITDDEHVQKMVGEVMKQFENCMK